MKRRNIYVFGFMMFLLVSCDILRDSPFDVIAWTPGGGFHETENLEISLLLSHSSDRIKTEQSFSLNEDGRLVKGTFNWEGRRLIFTPSSPLETNRDYLITLGTGAQDERGVSLENKFLASFTTRPSGERPHIISTEPHNGIIIGLRDNINIRFSEPVSMNSCINNITFIPTVSGSWRLDEDGKLASFYPLEPWKTGIRYRITINSAFASAVERTMGEDYFFYINTIIDGDSEKPVLLSVWAINPDNDQNGEAYEIVTGDLPGYGLTEYREWDSSSKLKLFFSELVDTASVKSRLTVEPYASLIMETPPGLSDTVTFRFAEKPAWRSAFLFKLSPGVRDSAGNETEDIRYFRICVANEYSKPPSLIGMRLPLAPGESSLKEQESQTFTPDDLYTNLNIDYDDFPYAKEKEFWLELYFDTAPGTTVDIFSLMNLFRVETTNNALTFSPRHIECKNFHWPDPAKEWECHNRIEIRGLLTNTVNSGVVTFRISSGLEDTRGNRSTELFRISLLK